MSELILAACIAATPIVSNNYHKVDGLKVCQEVQKPNEAAQFEKYASDFRKVHEKQQKANEVALDNKEVVWRGMHAKGHGCYSGKLTVIASTPENQVGFFKAGKSYPVTARFSNGSGNFAKDQKRDLRGLALKVSGVEGTGLIPSKWETGTQDFLMTNAPEHHTKDIDELMKFIKAMAGSGFDKAKFFAKHPTVLTTLLKQTGRDVHSLVAESYYSRAAFTWGDNQAVKYAAMPCQKISGGINKEDPDHLTNDLVGRMGTSGACFSLRIQKQVNPEEQPIEDHRTLWKTTYQEVAKITFEPQAGDFSDSCEKLKFNPWNGVKEFKPLGNFNRARRYVYEASQGYRASK